MRFPNQKLPEFDRLEIEPRPNELARLLRMPGVEAFDEAISGHVAKYDAWSRNDWEPRVHAAWIPLVEVRDRVAVLSSGVSLRISRSYARSLRDTEAEALVVLGFTVGPLESRIDDLWKADLLDEAYFLQAYAAMLAEALREQCSHLLCSWAEEKGLGLLSYDGPGYNDWPLEEVRVLYRILQEDSGNSVADWLRVLPSSMLYPTNSMIIAQGVTRRRERVADYRSLVPCRLCGLRNCAFRREKVDRS